VKQQAYSSTSFQVRNNPKDFEQLFLTFYQGIAAVCSFTLATTNGTGAALGVAAFGGLYQIGFAFGLGIAFAIITSASVSGGHFNPVSPLSSNPFPKLAYHVTSHDPSQHRY